jgi:SAM-dependent methyltransferase
MPSNRLNWFYHQEQVALTEIMRHCFGFATVIIGQALRNPESIPTQRHFYVQECLSRGEADICATYDQLPFAPESVDVLMMHHLVDHVQNMDVLLEEAKMILRHDGHLIITGINSWHPMARRLWHQQSNCFGHKKGQIQSIETIIKKLRQAGFEPKLTRRYGAHAYKAHSKWWQKLANASFRLMPWRFLGYSIAACKQVLPLDPIKPKWQKSRTIPEASTSYERRKCDGKN